MDVKTQELRDETSTKCRSAKININLYKIDKMFCVRYNSRTHFSSDLVAALAGLQMNNFTHFEERRRTGDQGIPRDTYSTASMAKEIWRTERFPYIKYVQNNLRSLHVTSVRTRSKRAPINLF